MRVGNQVDAFGEALPKEPGTLPLRLPFKVMGCVKVKLVGGPVGKFLRQSSDRVARREALCRRGAPARCGPTPPQLVGDRHQRVGRLAKWSISSPGIASVQFSFEPSLGLTKSLDQPATQATRS